MHILAFPSIGNTESRRHFTVHLNRKGAFVSVKKNGADFGRRQAQKLTLTTTV
jgi:hypothetical protein